MSRATRAAVAFGVAVVASGLGLGAFAGRASRWLLDLTGAYFRSEMLTDVAMVLLLGGLVIEGLALLGWIIAPRDDR